MSADSLLAELETQLRADWDNGELWAVYADALLARGDARGELISLELRVLAQGEDPRSRAEIEALQAEHEAAWSPRARDFGEHHSWHRGFIVGLRTRPLTYAEQLECLADPQLRMLARLDLRVGRWSEPELFEALRTLELGPLRALRLVYSPAAATCLSSLSALPASLEALDLRYAGLDDEGLALLLARLRARGPDAAPLRRLWLQHNQISARGISQLVRSECLSQLQLLDLRGNPLTTAGLGSLATQGSFAQLETLALDFDEDDTQGAELLASSSVLPREITRFWAARVHGYRGASGAP